MRSAQRTSGERGSVLSLVVRLSIFLAFSASRNISPALALLLSRECYTFSRSIDGVLHLAFTFVIVSAVRPSLVHGMFGLALRCDKKRLIWNLRQKSVTLFQDCTRRSRIILDVECPGNCLMALDLGWFWDILHERTSWPQWWFYWLTSVLDDDMSRWSALYMTY